METKTIFNNQAPTVLVGSPIQVDSASLDQLTDQLAVADLNPDIDIISINFKKGDPSIACQVFDNEILSSVNKPVLLFGLSQQDIIGIHQQVTNLDLIFEIGSAHELLAHGIDEQLANTAVPLCICIELSSSVELAEYQKTIDSVTILSPNSSVMIEMTPQTDDSDAYRHILALVDYCTKHSITTCLNLSGISESDSLCATLTAIAVTKGISAIRLPNNSETSVAILYSANALCGKDKKMHRYVNRFTQTQTQQSVPPKEEQNPKELIFNCVIQGNEEQIPEAITAALDANVSPSSIVDDCLIPAIEKVGNLFDKKEYFLPQLIMSADAMSKGFEVLEPYLESHESSQKQKEKVILATVKGDIHDIGKNIVALMLKNYNYDVIDLGKDVDVDTILDSAQSNQATLIGLSALMTTTMTEMKAVIEAAHNKGMTNLKFMIGGAVIDQQYADEIGADGYASDAMEAVRLADKLCEKCNASLF